MPVTESYSKRNFTACFFKFSFKSPSYLFLFPMVSSVNFFLNLDFIIMPAPKSYQKSFFPELFSANYKILFSASEAFDGTYPTNVVVTSAGGCSYIPPGIFKSTCKIDITWFPFDDQDCEMKFGSWTYNGFKVRSFCRQVIKYN